MRLRSLTTVPWRRPSAAAGLALLAVACSDAKPADDDGAKVFLGSDWACVDESGGAGEAESGAGEVRYSVRVLDWASREPMEGLTVYRCGAVDPSCSDGVLLYSPESPPRVRGRVDFSIEPDTRQSYLRIEGPFAAPPADCLSFLAGLASGSPNPEANPACVDNYVTDRYFFSPRKITENIYLLRLGVLLELAQTARFQVPLDPLLGVLAIRSSDCSERRARGAFFHIDQAGMPYTFQSGVPVAGDFRLPPPPDAVTSMETDDIEALGGFVNVPAPSLVTVRANIEDTMFSTYTVSVQPGTITIAEMTP